METECDEIMVDARHSSGILVSKQSNKECILTHRRESQNERLDSEISIKTSEDIEKKEPYLKRRTLFNLTKHIISTILIVMDLTLDWIEYSAMNNTGNYSINIERDYKKIKYTVECENSGESIQVIFLIVSVIGTVFSGLQIVNIIYQFYHELRMPRDKNLNKRLIHEYLEIFPSLVIEVMQILLIMGFYGVYQGTNSNVKNPANVVPLDVFLRVLMNSTKRPVTALVKGVFLANSFVNVVFADVFLHIYRRLRMMLLKVNAVIACIMSKLKPLRTDVFECRCTHCLACESDCQFCKLRCFPNYLHPSKEEWFMCTCCNTKVHTIAIHSVPISEIHSQLPVPAMRRELTRPLSVDENQPMHLPVVQQPIPMPIIQQHIPCQLYNSLSFLCPLYTNQFPCP
ncbi:unnamed protein product [Mytilus edulis]|uniref:Uncharacterized protein n=1 Tax=Mytilus edulis TaxID=6550 RepID=A0A8S3VCD6_MYTED|nr:unnamed protein product [Mytilus edulis]